MTADIARPTPEEWAEAEHIMRYVPKGNYPALLLHDLALRVRQWKVAERKVTALREELADIDLALCDCVAETERGKLVADLAAKRFAEALDRKRADDAEAEAAALRERVAGLEKELAEHVSFAVRLERILPHDRDWTVAEIKDQIASDEATDKQIYNAIGYLTRHGRITRLGQGRYRAALAASATQTAASTAATCGHRWVDARNSVVQSGEVCLKCGAMRATPPATDEGDER